MCGLRGTGVPGGGVMMVEKAAQTRLSLFFSALTYPLIFCFESI